MKVKKTYIAEDGKEFSTIKAAKEYEAGMALKKFVEDTLPTTSHRDAIYSFIRDNREELHALLSTIKNSMRGIKNDSSST